MTEVIIPPKPEAPLDPKNVQILQNLSDLSIEPDVLKLFLQEGASLISYSLDAGSIARAIEQIPVGRDEAAKKILERTAKGYAAAHGLAILYATNNTAFTPGKNTPPFSATDWDVDQETLEQLRREFQKAKPHKEFSTLHATEFLPTISAICKAKVSHLLLKQN